MSAITIGEVGERPEARAAFDAVRAAVGGDAGGSEPVPLGATLLLARRGAAPLACASIAVATDLHGAPGPSGLVGHYQAVDPDAGVAVLGVACRSLSARGVARVLGPVNGSTWGRYRLALRPAAPTADEDPPPFQGEPWNPIRYPADFAAAGFNVAARYESRIDESLDAAPADATELALRVRDAGVTVRSLALQRFDEELDRLFDLSLEAFSANLYYTPLDRDAFRAQYAPLRARIDPALVLVAEDAAQRPVAFQFALRRRRAAAASAAACWT
ncbi:MAG: hypothetical protein E6K80_02310 [Candidatus Eisenbacteria bacterium]|uniref:GNAT family N-acetyltransferase n=1 Tax=Eiseniibacteriota bacterium TaxID=2212470 RepID=A0A538U9Q2_UNCEI|nr:MAG: hypothetical protein E6K80_02310 [Candidatus Eisenbacteria bacterium]